MIQKRHAIRIMVMLTVLFLLPVGHGALFADQEWRLLYEKDGIQVHRRGVDGSKHFEYMGSSDVASPIDVIETIIKDIPSLPKWMHGCEEATVLEKNGPDEIIYYYAAEGSFAVKPRDAVVKARIQRQNGGSRVECEFHSIPPEKYIRENGRIHMPVMRGAITLERISLNATRVIIISWGEPGGNLPHGIVNKRRSASPYKTMIALKKMVNGGSYRK